VIFGKEPLLGTEEERILDCRKSNVALNLKLPLRCSFHLEGPVGGFSLSGYLYVNKSCRETPGVLVVFSKELSWIPLNL
jgi:hypothetical protein